MDHKKTTSHRKNSEKATKKKNEGAGLEGVCVLIEKEGANILLSIAQLGQGEERDLELGSLDHDDERRSARKNPVFIGEGRMIQAIGRVVNQGAERNASFVISGPRLVSPPFLPPTQSDV